jgi:hypothetical protein
MHIISCLRFRAKAVVDGNHEWNLRCKFWACAILQEPQSKCLKRLLVRCIVGAGSLHFFRYLNNEDIMNTTTGDAQVCSKSIHVRHPSSSSPTFLESLISQGINSLNRLVPCRKDGPDLNALIRQLRDAVRIVQEQSSGLSIEEQTRMIHPFTLWMNKYSISYSAISGRRPLILASLAHWYAVTIVLNLACPDVKLPLISPIRAKSILEIDGKLKKMESVNCDVCRLFHSYNDLMGFPMNVIDVFRHFNR